jgi:translation initiation factor 1
LCLPSPNYWGMVRLMGVRVVVWCADPFAEANVEDSGVGSKGSGYVHVRVQQRNGRKSLTTVQGLKKEFNYNKILKDLKKEFCCNGVVVQDPELGQVIQLQGDQRKNVSNFLVQVRMQDRCASLLLCLGRIRHSRQWHHLG